MPHALKVATCSIGIALSALACDKNIVSPALPDVAVKFAPLAAYTQWWATTESCSGVTGSLAAIQWYQIPVDYLEIDGRKVNAYWSAADNRIVLSSSVVKDGQVVRHEMLHALLREKGHSRAAFLNQCGGRVTCASQCVEDAGPAPSFWASVPTVSPSALDVSAEILPTLPNSASNGGYFSITVSVKNPAPYPVVADLPASASTSFPEAYSCRLKSVFDDFRSVFALDQSVRTFSAGETKIHIFDFFVGNSGKAGEIFPGTYTARCAYGGHDAPDWTFTAI